LLGKHPDLLEKFIKLGADINNSTDANGNDAAIILVSQGIGFPSWLIEHYSNWERTDSESRNLLHLVCCNHGKSYAANVEILLKKSNKLVNQKDRSGRTPLMYACR
jgi:ankyrin repeat protein